MSEVDAPLLIELPRASPVAAPQPRAGRDPDPARRLGCLDRVCPAGDARTLGHVVRPDGHGRHGGPDLEHRGPGGGRPVRAHAADTGALHRAGSAAPHLDRHQHQRAGGQGCSPPVRTRRWPTRSAPRSNGAGVRISCSRSGSWRSARSCCWAPSPAGDASTPRRPCSWSWAASCSSRRSTWAPSW